ncbi:MAG: family protein in fasciation locus, partial [Pseudomonadota bacterium]
MMSAMDYKTPFTLCVYCGSRPGTDPVHAALAREVGHWIGASGARLVYGGGHHGLMGAVADAALAAGAHVTGVIPQALVEMEAAHRGCSELHVVATMHERKHLMAERADAFLALPGGIGTFEELFEVWAWRQLGYHGKPIGLLNAGGYYDGLLSFLGKTVSEGFVGEWQMDLLQVGTTAADLLPRLAQQAARPGL